MGSFGLSNMTASDIGKSEKPNTVCRQGRRTLPRRAMPFEIGSRGQAFVGGGRALSRHRHEALSNRIFHRNL